MKLRQKLAAVLAATMMLTAIPVVTMAATEITNPITAVKDNELGTRAPKLKVDVAYTLTTGSEFYVQLDGGEWAKDENGNYKKIQVEAVDKDGKTVNGFVAEPTSKDEARVKLEGTSAPAGTVITLGLDTVILKGDVAKVSVDANETTVRAAKDIVIATAGETGKVVVTTPEQVPAFYAEKETLAPITIEESVVGQFASGKDEDRQVTMTLDNDDFKFDGTTQTITIAGKRGFTGTTTVPATVNKNDDQQITFTLPTSMKNDRSRGAFEITGLKVAPTTKTPETGELKAEVKVGNTTTTVKVAEIAEYGVKISLKDNKTADFVAGQKKDVEFSVKEGVKDTVVNGRTMEIVLENGYFTALPSVTNAEDVTAVKNDDDQIIGVEFKAKATSDIDEYKVTGKVTMDLVQKDETIKVTASGRAIGGETTAELAKVKAPIEIKTEAMTLSVGQSNQVGGKIVISETDKEMINRGNIELILPQEAGIRFDKADLKVEAEGFKAGKAEVKKENVTKGDKTTETIYKLVIPVTRTSKEAGSITIEGINVTVDRTVPQGSYDLRIGGTALAANETSVEVEDFFTIGTPNEDSINGLKKGVATFAVGTNKYTVNGVEKEMDAKAYVSSKGRTMIPVRYLSDAFGVEGKNIMFSNGTVVIIAGNKTIQLTNGSDIAIVNGAQLKMDEKVMIKENRTYVPVSQVGQILGVEAKWDQAAQTATFTNK